MVSSISVPVASYSLLRYVPPGGKAQNIAVLLLDPENDELYARFPEDPRFWETLPQADVEVLAALANDFRERAHELGGEAFLAFLEDTLSNVLQISDRTEIRVDDFRQVAEVLFRAHVNTSGTSD